MFRTWKLPANVWHKWRALINQHQDSHVRLNYTNALYALYKLTIKCDLLNFSRWTQNIDRFRFVINILFSKSFTINMFVTYSVTYCIYIPGQLGFCSHHYCAVYDECKLSDMLWPADRIRLFVHYTISLSSLCKFICRHWTYEMSARYILSSVWVRLSIFSQLSIIQYMGLYVFSLPNYLVTAEKIYCFVLLPSSNRKYELLSIV